MINHRLRTAISAAGFTYEQLAEELNVSPKTVERWVSKARVPYPRHRDGLATMLHKTELYLWPELADGIVDTDDGIGTNEVVRVYPHRSGVPTALWTRLLDRAKDRIDLLLYAGLFLVEQIPDLADRLAAKADAGVRVRLLLADPSCEAVAVRGEEEGIGAAVAAKIHNVVHYYRPLAGRPNVAVQFHRTTLYTSLYQFDDEMLVNTHVYGLCAAHAPVVHLRATSSGPLFETYIMSFDRVWQSATPTWPEPKAA